MINDTPLAAGVRPGQDTILIVDNNQTSVGILFEYLRGSGFRVLVARDGESAVKRAGIARPDLILMDVLMPGMNGFEACRLLKESPATRDIPVIFMTGLSETEDKMKGFAVGGVDYLTKPLQLSEVKARVITHLKIRHLVDELREANDVLVRRTNYLEINRATGEQITAILNLNDLLVQVVKFIRGHFAFTYTGIWLVNEIGSRLDLLAFDQRDPLRHTPEPSYALDASSSIIPTVCSTGQLRRTQTVWKAEHSRPEAILIELAIPLKLGALLLGVLYIQNEAAGPYEDEEITLLQIVGHQVAIAIRNAQLYQNEKRRLAEIETANKELEMFSYSVSHDLRAPLRAINGFCTILQDDYRQFLPPDGQASLEKIRASASRMGQLIDDLLAFSRLSRQPLVKLEISMADILAQVIEELKPEIAGRQVNLKIDKIPPCLADPSLLKQVWINLVSNAYKYTRHVQVAEIEVGSQNLEGQSAPVYFVKDNGVGFDMQYASKLFDVFQRLHSTQEFEGTGVGLAIVRRIVERHGGKVWAEAQVDHGATFYFTLGG